MGIGLQPGWDQPVPDEQEGYETAKLGFPGSLADPLAPQPVHAGLEVLGQGG